MKLIIVVGSVGRHYGLLQAPHEWRCVSLKMRSVLHICTVQFEHTVIQRAAGGGGGGHFEQKPKGYNYNYDAVHKKTM